MKLQKILLGLLASASLAGFGNAHAALSYMTTDNILRVWGKAEVGDVEKFAASLTPAISTVVLQSPDGSNWSLARDLGEEISKRKLTTVAHGPCTSFTCAMMFLSGNQRMFSGAGRAETHYVMLSFWEANTGSNHAITSDHSTMDDVLTWWSGHTKLKGSDLRVHRESMFYTRGSTFRYDHKVFFPADAQVSPANALHCSGEKEEKLERSLYFFECMPATDATALSKGIVTTDERFSLPALESKADTLAPAATTFAKLNDPIKLPLNDNCQKNYELFLKMDSPRAFVVSSGGGCTTRNAQSMRPNYFAMEACKKLANAGKCRFYAVDDQVVFTPFDQALPTQDGGLKPALTLKATDTEVLLGKTYVKGEGPKGVGDTFKLGSKIMVYAKVSWDNSASTSNTQKFEARWFLGDKHVRTSQLTEDLKESPHVFTRYPQAADIGVGSGHVEVYANGVLLGSKPFTITAN